MAVPGSISSRTGGETNTLGLFENDPGTSRRTTQHTSACYFPIFPGRHSPCVFKPRAAVYFMAGAPERAQTRGMLTAENGGMSGLTLHQVV